MLPEFLQVAMFSICSLLLKIQHFFLLDLTSLLSFFFLSGSYNEPFLCLMLMTLHLPDERKEMEKLIVQNGGKYSPELTKKCTHLICDISFT